MSWYQLGSHSNLVSSYRIARDHKWPWNPTLASQGQPSQMAVSQWQSQGLLDLINESILSYLICTGTRLPCPAAIWVDLLPLQICYLRCAIGAAADYYLRLIGSIALLSKSPGSQRGGRWRGILWPTFYVGGLWVCPSGAMPGPCLPRSHHPRPIRNGLQSARSSVGAISHLIKFS